MCVTYHNQTTNCCNHSFYMIVSLHQSTKPMLTEQWIGNPVAILFRQMFSYTSLDYFGEKKTLL